MRERISMARDDRAQRREEGGLADERISISFNFRQRRKDIDLATAPANEVVAGGSAREVTINY